MQSWLRTSSFIVHIRPVGRTFKSVCPILFFSRKNMVSSNLGRPQAGATFLTATHLTTGLHIQSLSTSCCKKVGAFHTSVTCHVFGGQIKCVKRHSVLRSGVYRLYSTLHRIAMTEYFRSFLPSANSQGSRA